MLLILSECHPGNCYSSLFHAIGEDHQEDKDVCVQAVVTLDLNLHGNQEDNKQHVAVPTLISLKSFYLLATLVFSILLVGLLGPCQNIRFKIKYNALLVRHLHEQGIL